MEPLGNAIAVFPAREEDDGEVVERIALANAQAHLVAVETRHVDIEQHKVHPLLVEVIQGLLAGVARRHVITHLRQKLLHLLERLRTVIHYENLFFEHNPGLLFP